jgi:hypothetical protein
MNARRCFPSESGPTPASLRALLGKVIIRDTELRALCIDHMPELLKHFGTGMSWDAMVNVLLEYVHPAALVELLERVLPEGLAKFRHLLVFAVSQSVLPAAPAACEPPAGEHTPASCCEPPRRPVPPPRSAYDPSWYARRPSEENLALEALSFPGAAVALLAPEAFGKTWLLQHIQTQVQRRGQIVNLNLRAFGTVNIMASYSRFLRELARQILVEATGALPEHAGPMIDAAWRYADNPIDNLNTLMEKQVLPRFAGGRWLLLALDGVDALSKHPYLEDFFTLLRSWMEDAARPPWSALRLMLTLAMAPRLLIANIHQSPFNVAMNIDLCELNDAQVDNLAALHGLSWSQADRTQVMDLIGGHPYLLRLAMYEARRSGKPVAELLAPHSRVFADYLAHCLRWLNASPSLRDGFVRAISDTRASLDFESFDRLRHAGLLVRDELSGEIRPRYPLYRRLIAKAPY